LNSRTLSLLLMHFTKLSI